MCVEEGVRARGCRLNILSVKGLTGRMAGYYHVLPGTRLGKQGRIRREEVECDGNESTDQQINKKTHYSRRK